MSYTPTRPRTRLIFDSTELRYDFGPQHPLQPDRLIAFMDLLKKSELWQHDNEQTRLTLRHATIEELGLVHTADNIAAVQRLSMPKETVEDKEQAELA